MTRLTKGGLINRSKPLSFTFDGKHFSGFAGDTLASALIAGGVSLVGRSFKYHRPRGIFTAGAEEPSALVELRSGARREPNSKATTVELFNGLAADSQNRFPSLRFDILSANNLVSPFLKAGFYYKTFFWPSSWWEKVYEPIIRRSAGLGRASGLPDPDTYEKSHAFCDVLVVGGGPAGLMAALSAARAGLRLILCEQDFLFGGRLLSETYSIDGMPAAAWAQRAVEELSGMAHVRLLPRTALLSVYDGHSYTALEKVSDHLPEPAAYQPRQRLWKIVARRAILATGSHERTIAFGGNDKPGVMQASALRAYVNRFAAAPGKKIAIFTSSDEGWRTAMDLPRAGVAVAAVIDPRPHVAPSLIAAAEAAGASVFTHAQVTGAKGGLKIKGIEISTDGRNGFPLACDVLGVSGGFNPVLAASSHLGARPVWSDRIAAFVPDALPPGLMVAGAAAGVFSLAACLADGAWAGSDVGGKKLEPPPASEDPDGIFALWRSRRIRGKAFVDLQNDVTEADVALSAREGFSNVEHLKRYTAMGMGTEQGASGALVGQALMAALTGKPIGGLSPPIARPPTVPVAIGVYAGHHRGRDFRPTRLTAGHAWAQEQGAHFTEAGQWLRAQWFARPGEDWLAAVSREAAQVRASVGVCDVSTLGKIDIQGPGAGALLDFAYINTFSTLPVGKARYGVMLREDGFVMDDGTTARLGETQYVMTTTTANAAKVMQHLEFCHQVLRPELDVQMVSVTEQWSQYAVAGPNARQVLAALVDAPFDISDTGFPFLAAAELTIAGGIPARLFRISFSGELAYEIAVSARYGDAIIRAIMAAGAPFAITPYGTEALTVLRIEKGHAAGNELNGQTTARDLGLERMMSTKKDFVGRVLARRPALLEQARPMLAGLRPVNRSDRLGAGGLLFAQGAAIAPDNLEGHLTSVCYSPALKHWIGLGLLRLGASRIGEIVRIHDPVRRSDVMAEICSPIFVDPEGRHLHV